MNMKRILIGAVLGLTASSVQAGSVDGRAVVGGAIGGATGAAVGSAVGGRDGAIVGGAIGGAAGVAIATQPEPKQTVVVHEHRYADDDRGHPPGKAKGWKKKRHHKHGHHH